MLRVLFLSILVAAALYGGPVGAVVGYVRDPSGGSVAGAAVALRNSATGEQRSLVSGARGEFEFLLLAPGNWTLTAKSPQFEMAQVSGVAVLVDQVTRVDILLKLGDLHEVTTVSAPELGIDPDKSTPGVVIDNLRISRLPLNGRQFLDIA